MIRDYITADLAQALANAQRSSEIPAVEIPPIQLARGRVQGVDYATSIAMQLARTTRMPPAKIAGIIVKYLAENPDYTAEAINGYVNFSLSASYLGAQVEKILAEPSEWGKTKSGLGKKAQVEHGSANPTGYATIGSGRNVVVGDTLANTLEACGYELHREWYINDAGSQVRVFGASIFARYAQALGRYEPMPEKGYQGDDVIEVASELAKSKGDVYLAMPREQAVRELGLLGIAGVMTHIKATLARLNIRYDNFFSEKSLYETGQAAAAVELLRAKGLIVEHDGAQWFSEDGSPIRSGQARKRTSEDYSAAASAEQRLIEPGAAEGLVERDDLQEPAEKGKKPPIQVVIMRSAAVIPNPEERATYFCSDLPYAWNKVQVRGFNPAVYVWGEDHQADVDRVLAGARALGLPDGAVRIIIYRFITLLRGGQEVRMGKRIGNAIWIDDVLGDIGVDAFRYIMLSRSVDTKFAFDLDLLKEQSDTNPVYYVQYGHARICSIERRVQEEAWPVNMSAPVAVRMTSEFALVRKLLELPEIVETVAGLLQPHHYTTYARELAQAFSKFYDECRIKDSPPDVAGSRLKLARAARLTLAKVLALMGMSTPERM